LNLWPPAIKKKALHDTVIKGREREEKKDGNVGCQLNTGKL